MDLRNVGASRQPAPGVGSGNPALYCRKPHGTTHLADVYAGQRSEPGNGDRFVGLEMDPRAGGEHDVHEKGGQVALWTNRAGEVIVIEPRGSIVRPSTRPGEAQAEKYAQGVKRVQPTASP
jgi:hypothetical protein